LLIASDLAVGVTLFTGISFFETIGGLGSTSVTKLVGLLLALAWLGTIDTRPDVQRDFLRVHPRISGTLIVVCPGKTVTIDQGVLIQPARSDYPALIVDGNLVLQSDSTSTLSEGSSSTNYNPAGAPYQGVADSDTSDTYPCEIGGLVHVTGTVTLDQRSLIRGMLICESGALLDAVTVKGDATIVYTPSLATSPPMGYTKSVTMVMEPGSYKQAVLP